MNRTFWNNLLLGVAALTVGHLCLIPIWDFATGGTPRLYVIDDNSALHIAWPLVITSWGLGIAAWSCLNRLYKKPFRLNAVIWLAFCLLAVFSVVRIFLFSQFIRKIPSLSVSLVFKPGSMGLALFLVIGVFLRLGIPRFARGSTRLALMLCPILPLLYVKMVMFHASIQHTAAIRTKNDQVVKRPIWILVFDELDEQSVEQGVSNGQLAEFARWRSFTLWCSNAYPPSGATLYSIPAMLRGKELSSDSTGIDYEFNLHTAVQDGVRKGWDWDDSLYRDIQKSNGTVALIGWCFPYAPLYGHQIHDLHWVTQKVGSAGKLGINRLDWECVDIAREVIGPILFFSLPLEEKSRNHGLALKAMESMIERQAIGPRRDLVWVHFPVPHWPAVSGPKGSYLDNLLAADAALKSFRSCLVQSGRWEDAIVIVVGDHWFRRPADPNDPFVRGSERRWIKRDHRVPLLIKLQNQTTGVSCDSPCNTLLLRSLVNTFRQDRLHSSQDIIQWIQANGIHGESDSTKDMP
ncbi:hypothetical protein GETHLI_35790 [Geothrix limicola]|uniref:Sulfatase N-terminal domain-containing protein n=1 Tax=Geothrix limicola TaxID=2927978 RepID=A0ABQ5QKL6_9BACT|nr:sulfatase-like hydrolase/transferase [Geothrix limicola]GLH75076.1 hypothetical protein GETHLI_35790 [Geothrix limicola]